MEKIGEIEDKIREIFSSVEEVKYHPKSSGWIEVEISRDCIFSNEMDDLSDLAKKHNLELHIKNKGWLFKRLYLYLYDKNPKV